MRLSKERVAHMADTLAQRLTQLNLVALTGSREAFVETLRHAITEELSVEDRLDDEVRMLMKKYEAEIEKGQVDPNKMFHMIKKQLAKERGLIL
jgi:hypothetical protein